MERTHMNTYEQVYIDMSIFVMDVKKKHYCISKHMACGVIPSIRSNWWCYPTSKVFLYYCCLLCVIVFGFIIRRIWSYLHVKNVAFNAIVYILLRENLNIVMSGSDFFMNNLKEI